MTWQHLDKLLREGWVLWYDAVNGAWIQRSYHVIKVHRRVADAVLRRDLAVVLEKHSAHVYSYRSKYEGSKKYVEPIKRKQ